LAVSDRHVNPEAVLSELKGFQRRTAEWVFERMFDEQEPSPRYLVADEVGLGKTHVAKGVVAQVIDHLEQSGDRRHDIVYVCSNGAIARQNLRKLVPKGIEPVEDIDRITMLPTATLNEGSATRSGVNLLAITPGTSLQFGSKAGRFKERALAYTFVRELWGADAMNGAGRWIFWYGITKDPERQLRERQRAYRPAVRRSLTEFKQALDDADRERFDRGELPLRAVFDELKRNLAYKRHFPADQVTQRGRFITAIREIMAIVGIATLSPDLIILDEFQRFKDLLAPDPDNFAAELAHRLFNFVDSDSGRQTRTLLLSATPYRMYTTADEPGGDHYGDFIETCRFLLDDDGRVAHLERGFGELRRALTSGALADADRICCQIGDELRRVMARTERLAATHDRSGMLTEPSVPVELRASDLSAYVRIGNLAQVVNERAPVEYWKSAPYLVNFMEHYQLKHALDQAALSGQLHADGDRLLPGPGVLSWRTIEEYGAVDPENGRLRWLLDDLEAHRAFELLWIPPSFRYYDTDSVYETHEARRFTKRLIFSGWAVVPKVVSCLVSYEAERRAYTERDHRYTAEARGGQRLTYRTTGAEGQRRPGEASASRRVASMTSLLLTWPSITLAELGDPRPRSGGRRPALEELLSRVEQRVADALADLGLPAVEGGQADLRWYWAAPLFLDRHRDASSVEMLVGRGGARHWDGDAPGVNLEAHLDEAGAMLDYGPGALGSRPANLERVLAELAVGGPAVCALRAVAGATGLPLDHVRSVSSAARIAAGFRSFFNGNEVTGVISGAAPPERTADEATARYWRDIVAHSLAGNLQALLDEHTHVLREWLGFIRLEEDEQREAASEAIARLIHDALSGGAVSYRVDIPRKRRGHDELQLDRRRMRTRFAAAFGNQAATEVSGEARIESISTAFNSPFWPFVLTSTSVGQEGLDFHLWCHAVVHWNLPSNPVDLEQREGRIHRYKGHAVRRNIAATIEPDALMAPPTPGEEWWAELFTRAARLDGGASDEMAPYWVFPDGPASIERLVPVLPFSNEAVALPQLRRTLAVYRLAFGQPRQEELIEFLKADRSDEELLELAGRLRIDLRPPKIDHAATNAHRPS
jgi:hypothetical protein